MGESKPRSIYETKRIYDLLKKQFSKIEEEKLLCDLVEREYVESLHRPKNRFDLLDTAFEKAADELYSKEKSKRINLKTISDFIKEDFFENEGSIKITEIFLCGFEMYGFRCRIEWKTRQSKKKFIFSIQFPNLKNITVENYKSAHHGKITVFNGPILDTLHELGESYNPDELKIAIRDFIEEQALEKEDDTNGLGEQTRGESEA